MGLSSCLKRYDSSSGTVPFLKYSVLLSFAGVAALARANGSVSNSISA